MLPSHHRLAVAGDTGLEIAPGSEAENAEALIADPGNIWNGVPQVQTLLISLQHKMLLAESITFYAAFKLSLLDVLAVTFHTIDAVPFFCIEW